MKPITAARIVIRPARGAVGAGGAGEHADGEADSELG